MIVVEGYVLLAGHSGGIEVVDISDPAEPAQAGLYEHETALPTAMAAVGGICITTQRPDRDHLRRLAGTFLT